MKKFHRALALFSAFLVMSLYIVPVRAVEVVDVDIFPVVTEGYIPVRGNEYVLTQSATRAIVLNGSVRLGSSVVNSGILTNQTSEFDWEGNGRYNWLSYQMSSASTYLYGQIAGGSFIDFYSNDVYAASEGGSVDVSGTVRFWLKPVVYSVNDGSSALPYDAEYALYPSRVGLIANGEVYGEPVQSSGEGLFSVNVSIPTEDPVTNLGFRFYYDADESVFYEDSNTTGKYMLFNIYDDSVVIYNEGESTNGLIHDVIQEVKLIPSTIYNFFFGEDGDEVAEGFKSEVDGVIDSGEEVLEEFEALEKPDPTDTIPDINVIIPQEEFQAYTAVFADVLQSELVLPLMVMALSMALMAYVVYGKKG